jgi:lysophospholipase L1-like esterase
MASNHFARRFGVGAVLLALGAVVKGWRFSGAIKRASRLAQCPPSWLNQPAATGGRASVLVLGDSLALGIGASCPQRTLWGRIAQDYPHCNLDVRAQSGARAYDLAVQLAAVSSLRYDVALLCVGANDVMRLGNLTRVAQQIQVTLNTLKRCASMTVVVTSANIGGAPIFFWPLSHLYSTRSLYLARAIELCADRVGASYVNVCFPLHDDLFARSPHLYFSADAVHPSDAAYAVVYELTKARVCLDSALTNSPDRRLNGCSQMDYA